jgi:hypothetical protein
MSARPAQGTGFVVRCRSVFLLSAGVCERSSRAGSRFCCLLSVSFLLFMGVLSAHPARVAGFVVRCLSVFFAVSGGL